MTDLTEQEVCIGSLGQQKVYLNWSDVKDICANEVLKAYEQTKKENQQLKDVISKMCMELVDPDENMSNRLAEYFNQDLLLEIHEVLK